MREYFDQYGNRAVHLTQQEWISVCDSVDLKSFPSTTWGRHQALVARAKELFGPGRYNAPEYANFRLRRRERRAGFHNPTFTVEKLSDGRKVRVGIRDKN